MARDFVTLAIAADELPCLVVGGGRVGARKARALAAQGAGVRVVAPRADKALVRLARRGAVRWLRRRWRTADLAGARLVVAATDDPSVNARVAREARRRGMLVCIASSASDTAVVFPALLAARGAVIAVHTRGSDPGLSKALRDEIAAGLKSRHSAGRRRT